VLLSTEGLEKVARYETHLERSLYKALHELQRLQAVRTGNGGAPIAFDVDVSVGHRGNRPEALDVDGELVEQ
jgi:selenocysteine lyase/cysteine desulfurase